MVTLQKSGDSAVKFVFTDSDHYLYGDGVVEVPVNSLSLVIDESDMVTFKKAATADPFISFRADNSNLGTKEAIEQFYKDNMVGSTGGGGSESGITSGEVQTMIDNSLEDYYDKDEVDAALSGKADASDVAALENEVAAKADTSALTAVANDVQTVSGQVATKVATSDFNAYSAATDARLAEDEEVTAAALNDLDETKQGKLVYYSEAETEDSETGETDKYGQIEVADELNGAHIYADYLSTNEEKSPYASIDAWVNDGEGNEKQNRVYADADGVGISADENADDGEGNIVHTTSNVSVSSTEIGMNVGEEGDTTTTLSITSTGVTINGDAVATEPYVDAATSGKADTSAVTAVNDALTAHTADTGIHVSAQEKNAWNAKAEPYSAGTGIEISGNVISATGGGGATYSAGTNISIANDTINCTIPAYFNSDARKGDIAIGTNINNTNSDYYKLVIGRYIDTYSNGNSQYSIGIGVATNNTTFYSQLKGKNSVGIGKYFQITGHQSVAIGSETESSIAGGVAIGYEAKATGTTKMNLNNQIKVDTNNQVYIKDKTNTTDVCIQDAIAALGGLKFVQCTQAEYDSMVSGGTVDSSTIYFITNVVS